MDRGIGSGRRSLSASRAGAGAWTTNRGLEYWRRGSFDTNAGRHRGFRVHAGRADGAGVRGADAGCVAADKEAAAVNHREVFLNRSAMSNVQRPTSNVRSVNRTLDLGHWTLDFGLWTKGYHPKQ